MVLAPGTIHKGNAAFDLDQRDEKNAEIMVDALGDGLG
jgi:hypothetical protein